MKPSKYTFFTSLLCASGLSAGLCFCVMTSFAVPADGLSLVCACILAALLFSALLLLYGAGISIWAFVDFIRILTGGLTPADGSAYTENHPAQVQVIQAAPSPSDNIDTLEKLVKLHEQGILTDDDFRQKKAELLAKM